VIGDHRVGCNPQIDDFCSDCLLAKLRSAALDGMSICPHGVDVGKSGTISMLLVASRFEFVSTFFVMP